MIRFDTKSWRNKTFLFAFPFCVIALLPNNTCQFLCVFTGNVLNALLKSKETYSDLFVA